MTKEKDYVLGINDYELERLRFQHGVWKKVTDAFFDRLNVEKGWKVLDVGSGPGFVAMDLMERIGDSGELTALEPSEMYLNYFKEFSLKQGWKNVKFVRGTAENSTLPDNYFDLIFARWVIGFVADAELFVNTLKKYLKPGGIIAFQDYAFEGLYLYPRSRKYENLGPAAEQYWK